MSSINKKTCPTCGQSVNEREINLFKGMVIDLWKVLRWCEENNKFTFHKKDIEHLLSKSVQANFAYWRWFGGLLYNPDDIAGHYGINRERADDFFSGNLEIPMTLYRNPLGKNLGESLRKGKYGTIRDVPNLTKFLDEDENYIARYHSGVSQKSLF